MSAYTDRAYDDFELAEFVACAPAEARDIATGWAREQIQDLGIDQGLPTELLEALIALHLISEGEAWA